MVFNVAFMVARASSESNRQSTPKPDADQLPPVIAHLESRIGWDIRSMGRDTVYNALVVCDTGSPMHES